MKGRTAFPCVILVAVLLALLGCDREAPHLPPVPAAQARPLEPWTWHMVGGLLVIEGEVDQPTEVVLKGHYLSTSQTFPIGPVRWEMYRPPKGEVADLRTADGRLLRHWDFDAPAPAPAPVVVPKPPSPPKPVPVELPKPPPPPKPVPVVVSKPLPPPKPVPVVVPKPPPPPKPVPVVVPKPPPPPKPVPVVVPKPPPPPRPVPAVVPKPPPPPKPVPVVVPKPPPPPKPVPVVVPKPPPPPKPVLVVVPKPPPPPKPGPGVVPKPLPPPKPVPVVVPKPPPPPTPIPVVVPKPPPPPKPVPVMVPKLPPTPKPVPVVVPKLPPPPKPVPVVVPAPMPVQAAPVQAAPVQAAPVQAAPVQAAPAPSKAIVPVDASLWPGAGTGVNIVRGAKGSRRICMTFDGGSTCEVAVEVLDQLKARGIHTSFFLTGEFVQRYPDLVRRMVQEGHEVGNHSFTHPHLAPRMKRDPLWTRERIQRELLDTDRAFLRLVGHPMAPFWRSPFGEQTPEIRKWVEEIGYRHVGWSEGADTLDWATVKERKLYRTGNAILDRLYARMERQDGDGLVVLMHLGSGRPVGDRPAGVLGPFLDHALKEGWHFVTIGDYVRSLGLPPWDPARRMSLLSH